MALNLRSMFVNPADSDRRFGKAVAADRVESKEFLMRRKDGTTFAALTRTQIVRKPDGSASHIEGFVTDISDYKRLEADRRAMEHEQRISARLQSVGALAAGIAHEINTPMQFVSDSVYFLKSAMGELKPIWPVLTCISKAGIDKEIANSVQYIKEALLQIDIDDLVIDANQSADRALEGIRRISTIIRAMREFAHPDNGEHSNVDINKAIETTLTVCKNVYKEIADVKTELSPMPPVLCQFGEINQVLLNIVVNAAHAIEARKSEVEKGLIRISTEVEETWAVIRIQDNGTGIPESVKTRIFDPFFTTKEVGKGTGQGLAIVQSVIVERHRGRISVDSEVGKGTTFTLRLPLTPRNTEAVGVENEQEA
jgi:signal transduction histidine kinase